MPPSLSQVVVDGGDREFVDQLKELLVKSGSTVLEKGAEVASINITTSEFEREVLTTGADGIATSYNFRYLLDFNVTDAEGTVLQAPVSLNQIRNLTYEPGNELEVENEETFLREEMEKELALQIMRRLSRL
jgi:outer membrane lipopolysaccharide assembly protein LptE/RlpB